MDVIEVTFPVRYVECDPLGVAHHSSYVVWFEVVRGEYMRRHPENYAELDRQGVFLPIAEMRVRYRAPARYGDEITVRSWIAELKSRRVTFAYEVQRAGDGQVLAEGETVHICLDLQTGALCAIPPKVREGLVPYLMGKGRKGKGERVSREGGMLCQRLEWTFQDQEKFSPTEAFTRKKGGDSNETHVLRIGCRIVGSGAGG